MQCHPKLIQFFEISQFDIIQNYFLMKYLKKEANQIMNCCICGLLRCTEATDHEYLSFTQFSSLLDRVKRQIPELDELKETVKGYYDSLKEEISIIIEKENSEMQSYLNKYYFSHLEGKKIRIGQLCEYSKGNFFNLPNKRVIWYSQIFKSSAADTENIEDSIQFQQVKEKLIKIISETKELKSEFKKKLPSALLKQPRKQKSLSCIKSQSDISNPEQTDEESAKVYTWKNITIKSTSKVVALSNKNITDQQLLREIPIISSFKNIKDFQIRHNKITTISCRLIASNLGHVKMVDIRGNPVGDEGILCIINAIPHLKGLMISDTNSTNITAKAIYQKLHHIETLLSENNKIQEQLAIKIANIKSLKVLSLVGNGLGAEAKQKLKRIFNSKGYVTV